MAGGWRTQQISAAKLLAIGFTQQMTADEVRVDIRTVRRWLERHEFCELVEHYRETACAHIDPDIWAHLRLAIEIDRRVLIGEIAFDDPRAIRAQRLIDRFLDRLLYVEPAPATVAGGNTPTGPAALIQINAQQQPQLPPVID